MKPQRDLKALTREEAFLLETTEEILLVMERDRISQTEVARRLGITPRAISQALQGGHNFTLRSLWRLVEALGYEVVITLQPKGVSPDQNSAKTRRYYLTFAGQPEREVDAVEYRVAALAAGFGELSCFSGWHGSIGRPSTKVEGRIVDE